MVRPKPDQPDRFLCACNELHSLMEMSEVEEKLVREESHGNSYPEAPWYGGFWEWLIGLTKTAIKKVLGRWHVSLSILEAITVEIQGWIQGVFRVWKPPSNLLK